ncbi:hypothetical protein [Candidatus Nitronereus thalassa]|uniref:Uncharacterized protein n=1 Tax=Candidatus Nitronereus thalassa TaxID=3020898 RepID=A0ABU3K2W7_9BACT|nr:hypothetical protein [Candidatus Nitronereus thalassa]MDT7040727.1 hypothetical protein [Candidatus Nitronereus thalassa]
MDPLLCKKSKCKNSIVSMAWILAATFSLLLTSPVPASAQELFVLSTESGLELYQAGNLIEPDLPINTYHSAVPPKIKAGTFSLQPILVHSGLQTTLNGRILTMAGRIDWYPSSGENPLSHDLVASLTLETAGGRKNDP